jgi:hypothetical protein
MDVYALRDAGTVIVLDFTTDDGTNYSRLRVRGQIETINETDIEGDFGYEITGPCIANTGGAPGEKLLGDMTTALLTTIEPIPSQFLYDQLITYKNDKQVQESNTTEVLRTHRELAPRPAAGRREKHHWDLVSALIMAVQAAHRHRGIPSNRMRCTGIHHHGRHPSASSSQPYSDHGPYWPYSFHCPIEYGMKSPIQRVQGVRLLQ